MRYTVYIMKFKAVVFDVDGVLTLHGEPFSQAYARANNKDYAGFRAFFQGEFQNALIGKADLKQLILAHDDLWESHGDVDHLLAKWFSAEHSPNTPLLDALQVLHTQGTPCYIATNQEKYRGTHLIEHVLPKIFDGYFVSALVGSKKPTKEFFGHVIEHINAENPGIEAKDILFIDDSPEHIEGALACGINAHLYKNNSQVMKLLSLQ